MREIEIKVRISSKKVFLGKLQKKGIAVSEPLIQRDQVFGLPGVDGGDNTNGAPWLRIRTETKNGITRQIFTLKKSVTNQMDSIEHETEINDALELAAIIKHLGFTPYSDLTKSRQKARMGDIELCIDRVEGLGDFVEAEKLTEDDADYDAVAEELWQILESFGIKRSVQVIDGYDVLMRKHQGLKG